jgi:hypothetical protein
MTCRISRFQDGGPFQLDPLVTTCRLRILCRLVTNQIRRYKQIAFELKIELSRVEKYCNLLVAEREYAFPMTKMHDNVLFYRNLKKKFYVFNTAGMSTIFQLYHGSQLNQWRKMEYLEKITDLP